MNKKTLLVIEIVWILMGLLCLALFIREVFARGFGRSWIFLIMTAAAFALAWVRDRQRKKM